MDLIHKMAFNVDGQDKPLYYGICSPTGPQGEKTSYLAFMNELADLTLDFELRKKPVYQIEIPLLNAVVYPMSAVRPDSLKGPNLTGVWIDEPFIQARIVYENLIARIRQPEARYKFMTLTGTPEDLNWGYDTFKACEPNGEPILNMGIKTQLITAPTTENYHLGEDYFNMLYSQYDDKMIQAYLYGRFVAMSTSAVYHAFDRRTHVKDLNFSPVWKTALSFDFNVDPMSVLIIQYIGLSRYTFFTRVISEVNLRGSNTQEACREAQRRLREFGFDYQSSYLEIYGDASHPRSTTSNQPDITDYTIIRKEFPNATFLIPTVNPPVKRRHNIVNGLLKNSKNKYYVEIDHSCRELIKDFEQCKYKPGSLAIEDKSDPLRTHKADAFGYFANYRNEVIRNRQQTKYTGSAI